MSFPVEIGTHAHGRKHYKEGSHHPDNERPNQRPPELSAFDRLEIRAEYLD
jgi:hypothetical protein